MKRKEVLIKLKEGLHLRPAAQLVKRAIAFESSIFLKVKERSADATSILAILMLAATMGSTIEIEANGADENEAVAAITSVLEGDQDDASVDASTIHNQGESNLS